MFPPDADESPYHPKPTEPKPKERVIKHTNTRLPEQEEGEKSRSEPPSPTRSRIDAAIMGTACQYTVPVSIPTHADYSCRQQHLSQLL